MMLIDIRKLELHHQRCDWRDERYGYCNTIAKYLVAGIACCGIHMSQAVKKELEEDDGS